MFKTGHHDVSHIDSGGTAVWTVDVFPEIAQSDLVKTNIEGSEWAILEDPRLTEVSPIGIVEERRMSNPEGDIYELARSLFERCRYTTRLSAKITGNGLLWAWKRS